MEEEERKDEQEEKEEGYSRPWLQQDSHGQKSEMA